MKNNYFLFFVLFIKTGLWADNTTVDAIINLCTENSEANSSIINESTLSIENKITQDNSNQENIAIIETTSTIANLPDIKDIDRSTNETTTKELKQEIIHPNNETPLILFENTSNNIPTKKILIDNQNFNIPTSEIITQKLNEESIQAHDKTPPILINNCQLANNKNDNSITKNIESDITTQINLPLSKKKNKKPQRSKQTLHFDKKKYKKTCGIRLDQRNNRVSHRLFE